MITSQNKNRLSILHLEDDLNDAEIVETALQRAGLQPDIMLAKSDAEYQVALAAGPYDVILSDNKVPGIDGTSALRLAREKMPEVPFIFVSGQSNCAPVKGSATGAAECVGKTELNRLPEVIQSAIENATRKASLNSSNGYVQAVEYLVEVVQQLSLARSLDRIATIVRRAARVLTGADGATFVLREGDLCHYADEDAIAPLWKGRRFPLGACISGWVMLNRKSAVIEDIYADPRIPAEAYRPTFVKSLAMVPIRTASPVGAIGNYWASHHDPTPEEVMLLQALADSTSVAMENVQLYAGLEQKVADRTARLQLVNEELEAFSYSVSHDLRAPLRHIGAFAELMQEVESKTLSPTGKRHLDIIIDSVGRMNQLIEDLLEFSRMSRSPLAHHEVDMNRLVDEIRSELEPETAGREINWQVDPLPVTEGDAALLRQVWSNLLSNAVKFTRKRERASIRVRATEHPGHTEYTVADNGAGFDMEHSRKLFGVFERLHRADEFEGTGIGLANVRRIISRHGGRTWAEGAVDRGATVHFTLPTTRKG
ncbi:MAG TPA: histidine kinase [Verrucomicrobiales bacterium]|nr:histidine kinase [Verrucomicrobiales bacterium]